MPEMNEWHSMTTESQQRMSAEIIYLTKNPKLVVDEVDEKALILMLGFRQVRSFQSSIG